MIKMILIPYHKEPGNKLAFNNSYAVLNNNNSL